MLGLCCHAGFSPLVANRGYSLLVVLWFSLWWLLLLQSMGSRACGLSTCSLGSSAQAQYLWHTGLVALLHGGSSRPGIEPVSSALPVQFSGSVMSDSLQPHRLQHSRPPCPSPTPRVYSDSCLLSWWCHPTMSSSVPALPCGFFITEPRGKPGSDF